MEISKESNLEEIKLLYSKLNSSELVAKQIAEKYNIPYSAGLSRKIRKWVSKEGFTKTHIIPEGDGELYKIAQNKKPEKAQYYLISSAQNATKIHKPLWANIQAYAEYLNASIEIIPMRYKNPTSVFSDLPYDWWDADIRPYLIANRHKLSNNLTVVGDLKIQPTASLPLSGIEGLTRSESCIIGHPRQHFYFTHTLDNAPFKLLMSTGSVTLCNYTDSKAGKRGEFNHEYGFVIVEIVDKDTFHIRHISATDDGNFYDLNTQVTGGVVYPNQHCVDAMVLGDLHYGQHNEFALETTYKMLDLFKPKQIILHDLMDGLSVSHHDRKDPFMLLDKEVTGSDNLQEEIKNILSFIDTIKEYHPVVVKSNHDDFVDRWLRDVDWRKENNKYEYLKYAHLIATGKITNGVLAYELEDRFGDEVKVLTTDSSHKVNGWELAVHGHLGTGGSRGTPIQYKKLNTKIVTGHSHSPCKIDNLQTVGTLTNLRLGYNKGLSNWYHSNVVIHSNGKTQNLLITPNEGFTNIL